MRLSAHLAIWHCQQCLLSNLQGIWSWLFVLLLILVNWLYWSNQTIMIETKAQPHMKQTVVDKEEKTWAALSHTQRKVSSWWASASPELQRLKRQCAAVRVGQNILSILLSANSHNSFCTYFLYFGWSHCEQNHCTMWKLQWGSGLRNLAF